MEKKADLHIHSIYSDGTKTPEEIIVKAKTAGLAAISFTDHDTTEGYHNSLSLVEKFKIEIISGIELSCHYEGKEYHILGYNFDPDNKELKHIIQLAQESRLIRAEKIVEKLKNNKVDITIEDVYDSAGTAPLARPHIANAMLKKGYVSSSKEAFNVHIGEGRYAYNDKKYFPVEEGIKILNNSGGVAILAHPAKTISQDNLYQFIKFGLDGVEVYHPLHDQYLRKHYHSIVSQYLLVETGGSDYHGNRDYDDHNFGKVTCPYSSVEAIKYSSRNS